MPRFLFVTALLTLLTAPGCQSVENSLIYHPRPADPADLPPPAPLEDLELTTASGAKIHARWAPNPTGANVVLFCHGNGGNIEGWARPVREIYEQMQASVLIFDYPGYGKSVGETSEAGCYAAAEAAYRWLTETRRVPPQHIMLWGESLGGAVAVELASRKPHAALVLVRSFTSMPEVAEDQMPLLPCGMIMSNRFNSLERIGQCSAPIFIASAEQDRLVQPRHGERLLAACTAPAQLCILKGIGHNDPLPERFYSALRSFIARQPSPAAPNQLGVAQP